MSSFIGFKEFLLLEKVGVGSYNDEHALVKVGNHFMGNGTLGKIAKSPDASEKHRQSMHDEIEKAKTDPSHPLHFKNASSEGFKGGDKKKAGSQQSYYDELHKAVDTMHSIAKHSNFAESINKKHKFIVMGAEKGGVSEHWKKHGAGKGAGATSKSDVALVDPKHLDEHGKIKEDAKGSGISISVKKGGGSQLMSAGKEETHAVASHATERMLSEHPKYKNLSEKKKNEIREKVSSTMQTISDKLKSMKGSTREEAQDHKIKGQEAWDKLHKEHPELSTYMRHEATSGHGKFGRDSAFAASHIVTGAEYHKDGSIKHEASVEHVDDMDHSGPGLRIATPKADPVYNPKTKREEYPREGNAKLDKKSGSK